LTDATSEPDAPHLTLPGVDLGWISAVAIGCGNTGSSLGAGVNDLLTGAVLDAVANRITGPAPPHMGVTLADWGVRLSSNGLMRRHKIHRFDFLFPRRINP
jgi:hypothetical protein